MIKKNVSDNVLTENCDIKSLPPVNPDFTGFAEVIDFYGPAFFEKSVLHWIKAQDLKLDLLGATSRSRLAPENNASENGRRES